MADLDWNWKEALFTQLPAADRHVAFCQSYISISADMAKGVTNSVTRKCVKLPDSLCVLISIVLDKQFDKL